MNINFKFEIGDSVTHTGLAGMAQLDRPKFEKIVPQRLQVFEQWAQICPGGTQLWYDVRGFATLADMNRTAGISGIKGTFLRLREDELVKWDSKWDL